MLTHTEVARWQAAGSSVHTAGAKRVATHSLPALCLARGRQAVHHQSGQGLCPAETFRLRPVLGAAQAPYESDRSSCCAPRQPLGRRRRPCHHHSESGSAPAFVSVMPALMGNSAKTGQSLGYPKRLTYQERRAGDFDKLNSVVRSGQQWNRIRDSG